MLRSGAVSSQEAVLCDVDGPWQAGESAGSEGNPGGLCRDRRGTAR